MLFHSSLCSGPSCVSPVLLRGAKGHLLEFWLWNKLLFLRTSYPSCSVKLGETRCIFPGKKDTGGVTCCRTEVTPQPAVNISSSPILTAAGRTRSRAGQSRVPPCASFCEQPPDPSPEVAGTLRPGDAPPVPLENHSPVHPHLLTAVCVRGRHRGSNQGR